MADIRSFMVRPASVNAPIVLIPLEGEELRVATEAKDRQRKQDETTMELENRRKGLRNLDATIADWGWVARWEKKKIWRPLGCPHF